MLKMLQKAGIGIFASKISHKNILLIHDKLGDTKFITMAYVEAHWIYGQFLRDNPKLPLDRILRYATQLAEALAVAHAEGVVHRDLKPQNILVNKEIKSSFRTRPGEVV